MSKTHSFDNKVTERKPVLFLDYKPARYHTGKDCYVSYYALDPCLQKLKIKKIRLNNIRSTAERKKMAIRVIQRVNNRLERGWNTTNALDGQFADLKNKLRNHNGLSKVRKMKFIDGFFKV